MYADSSDLQIFVFAKTVPRTNNRDNIYVMLRQTDLKYLVFGTRYGLLQQLTSYFLVVQMNSRTFCAHHGSGLNFVNVSDVG